MECKGFIFVAMPEIILPEVELNIYSTKSPIEVTVVENYVATKESSPNIIRHITFDITGTDLVGRVVAGQSIGVLAPGLDERGKPHKLRLYSVSSPSNGEGGKRHLISTTVKRDLTEVDEQGLLIGVCSNYLCDLNIGDKVTLTGPSGKRFLIPKNAEDFNYVFFATGTGIAPYRGMIMDLMEKGFSNEIALVFGCPYRTDVLYPTYFEEVDAKHTNFHYFKCISREDRRPDGSKYYVQSALLDYEDTLAPILSRENTLIYLCGLKGMETGIYHNLAKMGLTDYLIIKEPLEGLKPEEWDYEVMKKNLKPSARAFEEVY